VTSHVQQRSSNYLGVSAKFIKSNQIIYFRQHSHGQGKTDTRIQTGTQKKIQKRRLEIYFIFVKFVNISKWNV